MKLAGIVALATLGTLAAACSRSTEDENKPVALGFSPPGAAAPGPAAGANDAAQPAPAFTSYFDRDSGATQANATGAANTRTTAARAVPDPDAPSQNAIRARLNGCFPLAKLGAGTSRTVAVTFTVIATGRVSRYDISGADSSDGAFYDCVHGIADSTTFPERSTTAVPGGPPAAPEVRSVVVTAGATAS